MNEELIDFTTWLSKKGYLNHLETDREWDEQTYESIIELDPEEVLSEYEDEKKNGNIV
jgi:hypothetical protein